MQQRIKITFIFFLIPYLLPAQGWETHYGEEAVDDRGNSIQQTYDGGYIIAGESGCDLLQDCNILLLKLDEAGEKEWATTLLPDEIGRGMSVIQTVDSGYVVCGTLRTDPFAEDIFVTKTDRDGEEIWTTIIGDSLIVNSYKVVQLESQEFIVAGSILNESNFIRELLISKLDVQGNEIWTKTYPDPSDHFPEDMIILENGNVAVVGFVLNSDVGTMFDYFLFLAGPEGDSIHYQSFGTPDTEGATAILQLSNKDLIIIGSWSTGDLGVFKFDENGAEIWMEVYSQNMYGDLWYIVGLTEPEADHFTMMTSAGKWIYLVKMDNSGNVVWETRTGNLSDSLGTNRGYEILTTDDGGYALTGFYQISNLSDVYVLKTDANGDLVFATEPEDEKNIYINLFPNPSSDFIYLESEESLLDADLVLYNTLGQLVYRKPIQNTISVLTVNHLDSGIYFYEITKNRHLLASGKLVLE